MKIQKRDGRVVPYEEEKIREAIHKANNEVEERYRASEGLIEEILEDVQQEGRQTQTVEHIQDMNNSISAVISVIWSISIGRTIQRLLSIMTIS